MKTVTVSVPDGMYARLERAAKTKSGTVTNQVMEASEAWQPALITNNAADYRVFAHFDLVGYQP